MKKYAIKIFFSLMVLIDPGRACRILSQIPVSVLKECRSLYLAGTFSPKFTPMTEWSFMCYRYLFLCSSHVRKTIGFPKRENIIMEPWFNLVCVLGDPLFSQSWSQSSGLSRIFPGTAFFIGCCYRRWLCNRYQNPGFFLSLWSVPRTDCTWSMWPWTWPRLPATSHPNSATPPASPWQRASASSDSNPSRIMRTLL